jgi:hypothetical protein
MAFSAQVTKVRDSNNTKICTLTCLDTDAAGTAQAYLFANAIGGMRPCRRGPSFVEITKLTGPDSESEFQATISAVGFTITKLTAGAVGAPITLSVKIG